MYDVIIIGSGPAGLMAGTQLQNKKVLLLEKNNNPGVKLLLTGGGRCNLTNLKNSNEFLNNINYNKKYLYSAINKFGPYDIYNYFINNGVKLKEEEENKIFPISNKASDILNTLVENNKNTIFRYNEQVINIQLKDNYKEVITNKNIYQTKNIIIATGGSSYKHTGSTGDNLKFAKLLNQPVVNIFPAEVGIILKDKLDLAGTSLNNVEIKYINYKKSGNLIFTHKGLSGTSIMKMSEFIYLNNEKIITIDFLPDTNEEELINMINNYDREKEILSFMNTLFSKKLSIYLINRSNINIKVKIKQLVKQDIVNIINIIKQCSFDVQKVDDINNAYVTGGGIDLNYVDTTTMESKINKGIYFVGESLDIHGPIGGYNITLALSTGFLAGTSIKE